MGSDLPKAAPLLLRPVQVYKPESADALRDNNFHLYRLLLFVVHPHIILSLIPCGDPGIGGGLGTLLLPKNLWSNVSDLAPPGDLGLKPPSRTQAGALCYTRQTV